MQSPNNMVAKCQGCGETKEGNYIKYNFNGFELMFLVCIDCFTHVQLAGLRELRGIITTFRTDTRREAKEMVLTAERTAKEATKKKKVSKRVPVSKMKPLGQNRGAVRVPQEKK